MSAEGQLAFGMDNRCESDVHFLDADDAETLGNYQENDQRVMMPIRWVCPITCTVSTQLSLFLNKAFINHHHPRLLVLG